MSRAASLPGAELFPENLFFYKNPLVPGSFAAWGRTFARKSIFFEEATCPGQLRCLGQNFFSTKRALRNYGPPLRRTRRRKSQKMSFQEFWDSCAQSKRSEISTNAFRNSGTHKTSEISKKCTFKNSRTPVRPPDPQRALRAHGCGGWSLFA